MPISKRTALAGGAAVALVVSGIGAATAALPLAAPAAVTPGFTQDRSADLAKAISTAEPRNVILIIGDGTDDSIITAARNYELGAAGRFALDELPFTGEMTTYGLKTAPDGTRYPINYVSDSAPTASGWSTGKKTVDGRISQGPSSAANIPGDDYETVLEQYQAQGKRVGNVSTAEITDATPAAAASHISQRGCQGPTDLVGVCESERKANGGLGSIGEQLVDHEIDVLLGGGLARFDQPIDAGGSLLDYATTTRGYDLVQDETALAGVTSLADGPVLGLFTTGNMTPRYQPLVATAVGAGGNDTTCQPADRGTQPTLADMTSKAIELLDNSQGFFLQVESAMVDKQEHSADICGAVGDVLEMDNALKVAQAYQATHPDTLIIVTGDHAHSTQIVPNGATSGKQTATIKTADGDPMTVAYSTNTVPGSMTHTGSQIRVAASGPQAANVTGTIDQTDLFATLLGRTPSTLPGTTPTTPTTPAPATPSVSVAVQKKFTARQARKGIQVAVAATGSTSVSLTLAKGGKVVDTATLAAGGGVAKLQPGKKKKKKAKGIYTVTVTATGAGGTSTGTASVKVR